MNFSKYNIDPESLLLTKMAYISDFAGNTFDINDEDMYANQAKLFDPRIQ